MSFLFINSLTLNEAEIEGKRSEENFHLHKFAEKHKGRCLLVRISSERFRLSLTICEYKFVSMNAPKHRQFMSKITSYTHI